MAEALQNLEASHTATTIRTTHSAFIPLVKFPVILYTPSLNTCVTLNPYSYSYSSSDVN